MFQSVCKAARSAVERAGISFQEVAALGLDNQGETTITFDSTSGHPVGNAISWQDRRTEDLIEQWRQQGLEEPIRMQTGLRLDPYFSASKLKWVLNEYPEAGTLLKSGKLRMGTSDGWLIRQLTGGQRFVTDAATASRTMMLDLEKLTWSEDLLGRFELPAECLPEIVRCDECIGETDPKLFGIPIPITGLCVDQHAALFGQGCFNTHQAKATYGTGCFLLNNIGNDSTARAEGLLTLLAWQLKDSKAFAVEGGVYSAGSIIEWLVKLGWLEQVSDLDAVAGSVDHSDGTCLIPAFSGLAAPHWKSRARACWSGMHNGTEPKHLVRAAVESIAFRVREIYDAMSQAGLRLDGMKVDGGLTRSQVLMQIQSDILGVPLTVSENPEATATGVALMAGLGVGWWSHLNDLPEVSKTAAVYQPNSTDSDNLLTHYNHWSGICKKVAAWN